MPTATASPNELDPALVDYFEFYLLNYFRPAHRQDDRRTHARTAALMQRDRLHELPRARTFRIEHDRRVADVDTRYDADRGIFNHLFATATHAVRGRRRRRRLPAIA